MRNPVRIAVSAGAILVIVGTLALVLVLVLRSRDPAIKSIPPDLVLTMTHIVPFEAGIDRHGRWRQGTFIKVHPDGPDRYLVRAASSEGPGPRSLRNRRVAKMASEGVSSTTWAPDDPRLGVLREDETDEFRRLKVLDIDIANRRLTLADNDTWDRALPPEAVQSAANRPVGKSSLPLGSGRESWRKEARESPPKPRLVGGSIASGLGMVNGNKIHVYGVFDFPWDELMRTEEGRIMSLFAHSSGNGNGHLFVQFVDATLGRRVGPVIEAQMVAPLDYPVEGSGIVTPDEKFVLVITDEGVPLGSPSIVTRVSVIRVPEFSPSAGMTQRPGVVGE
jgi:hypothetical protein